MFQEGCDALAEEGFPGNVQLQILRRDPISLKTSRMACLSASNPGQILLSSASKVQGVGSIEKFIPGLLRGSHSVNRFEAIPL